jgi:hypothetical protein
MHRKRYYSSKAVLIVFVIINSFGLSYQAVAEERPDDDLQSDSESQELSLQVGDKLKFFGQVGFRVEYMANERFAENDSTADDDHRFRHRVRLRFGAEFTALEWLTAGFRISTGHSSYPASGWSSFSDNFARDPVALDRIYITMVYKKFKFMMGADSNPLFRPTELVWDDDVQTAGFAEVFRPGRWEIMAGQFKLTEVRSISDPEESGSYLFAHGITYSPPVSGTLKLGIFQYYYNKPDAIAIAIDEGQLDPDFKTNRLLPDDERKFFSDYNSIGASLLWAQGPWQIISEAVVNLAARSDASLGKGYTEKENVGYGVLLRYGILNEVGDWSLEGGFFHIEADATIAAYNSDDYQQTNVNAVPLWLRIRMPGGATLIWDTYFQKRINTALYLSGGIKHDENALKVRTRLTLQIGF